MKDDKAIDPFIAALERELAACNTGLPPDTDPDTAHLMGIARSIKWRQKEMAEVREWAEKAITNRQNEIERIWGLERWAIARIIQRKAKPGARSVVVPGMLFGQRKVKPRIEWAKEDTERLIEWARENCSEALSTSTPEPRTTPLKTELLAYYEKTGRVPHGCRHTHGGDETYYRAQKLGAPEAEEETENGGS